MTSLASTPEAGPLPVIRPHGDLDYGSVPWLQEEISTAVDEHGGVILDAGEITFIDSTIVALVLTTHQRTHLRMANLTANLARVFSIYGIDRVLRIYRTVDAAQAA
ncbi:MULTISPECIES: STAS domain-containing protein [unclassified Streptomyces]|uniref:STAS domain-containing protein n=1 Tax=unclassified Streptomyces TaxID=2593676 RepID=UPI000B84960C|nr:STAS domain-containing protein [Streptomyces sp. MnatMP-M77]MYT79309.1 STAS domain-containing protein [Streptomyces sp. SID8364]